MPTYNRRDFIPAAVSNFLSQKYPDDWEVNLVILDDGDSIKDLVPSDSRIQYFHELPKRNHGDKMNHLAELATGEILIVWDDDDRYSADRLARFVKPFENPEIQIVGTSTLYYQDGERAWQYTSPKSIGWLASIAFRKTAIQRYPFESRTLGADWIFQQKIRQGNPAALVDLFDPSLVVARIHLGNACKKHTGSLGYVPVSWETVENLWATKS
jgi:glycosyltransferase involved in cell wall biosynthesis